VNRGVKIIGLTGVTLVIINLLFAMAVWLQWFTFTWISAILLAVVDILIVIGAHWLTIQPKRSEKKNQSGKTIVIEIKQIL